MLASGGFIADSVVGGNQTPCRPAFQNCRQLPQIAANLRPWDADTLLDVDRGLGADGAIAVLVTA